jgi:tetratricopeptide (TPR) repeat protein
MRRPSLAPSDADFTDTRGGWGWGDRCWINLKKKKYGWAKAECDKAMAMNPKAPSPRASILYNLGLIEQGSGNLDAARTYYQQSLALREHPEVRAALESVAGSPNSQPGDDLGESVVLGPKGVCDLIYGGTDCVMFCETDGFCAQLLAKKQLGIGKCTLDPGLHKKRKTCGIKP